MSSSLADQVIWITGASSGIGEAVASEYARYGAKLVLSARRREELERVRAGLVNADEHLVLPLDLTDQDAMAPATETVLRHFGRLDQVVHNGGISQRSLVRDTDMAVDRRIMEVNYFGAVALTKAVLPAFIRQGGGRFVVVTSLVGELPTPKRSAYSASKHALHGFFEALRAEEFDNGVRVTLVNPGMVRSSFFDGQPFRPGPKAEHAIEVEEVGAVVSDVLKARPGLVFDEINLSPLKKVIDFSRGGDRS